MPNLGVLFDLDNTLYHYDPCNKAGLAAAHAVLRESIEVSGERFRQLHDDVRGQLAVRLRGQAASHNRVLFFKAIVEAVSDKPRPDLAVALFAMTLEGLGVAADAAVMVGDRVRGDIDGAKAAGLRAIYTTEFLDRDAPADSADHTISHLAELLQLL